MKLRNIVRPLAIVTMLAGCVLAFSREYDRAIYLTVLAIWEWVIVIPEARP